MLASIAIFILSWFIPNFFIKLFKNKLSKGKIRLIFGLSIVVFFMAIGFSAKSTKNEKTANDNKEKVVSEKPLTAKEDATEEITTSKNKEQPESIKYKEERLAALSTVQAYKIQKAINEGNAKYEVKMGTKLYDVFKLQKESGYLNSDGRWVVVKDGERFIIIYRSSGLNESLNNPQWAVLSKNGNITEGEIKALNGTAKKYTPELGVLDLSEKRKSKELSFYLD